MPLRYPPFFRIVFILSGVAALFFSISFKCIAEPRAPEEQSAAQMSDRKAPAAKNKRKTLFEKEEQSGDCTSNPAACEGYALQMDIKKEMKLDIVPEDSLSTSVCVGGCSKSNALQWRLEWQ